MLQLATLVWLNQFDVWKKNNFQIAFELNLKIAFNVKNSQRLQ